MIDKNLYVFWHNSKEFKNSKRKGILITDIRHKAKKNTQTKNITWWSEYPTLTKAVSCLKHVKLKIKRQLWIEMFAIKTS